MNDQTGADNPTRDPADNAPLPANSTMPGKPHTESPADTENAPAANFTYQRNNPNASMTPYEYVSLILSGFTLAMLIVTATVYYYQLGEMIKATDASKKSADAAEKASNTADAALKANIEFSKSQLLEMKKSTQATEIAANSAKAAAEIARDGFIESIKQFRIDERPYITIEHMTINEIPRVGSRIRGSIGWKNTGKTPALKGLAAASFSLAERQPTDYATWPELAKRIGTPADVGAGVIHGSVTIESAPLTQGQMDAINSGQLQIYISGVFVYRDFFGDEHYTTALGTYAPNGGTGIDLVATKEGNEVK